MKNKSVILTALLCVFSCVSAFDAGAQSRIQVWSSTDDLKDIIDNYYLKDNSRARLSYTHVPFESLPERLDQVLASGRNVPDVFTLEVSHVRKYVESGALLDLTDIYERNKSRLLAYPVEIGTYNGRVYAMSWHAFPGAMFYRRSLAMKYLGTDDPEVVQAYFADFDKFMETAALLKDRSGGSCVVTASRDDLYSVFLDSRKQPWVVNGSIVIDPNMERFMEVNKIIYDNRYDARLAPWSEGWFTGMQDQLRDENGRRLEVFSYFLPSWGLHYGLKNIASETAGDWAMIPGPSPYYLAGGTWLAAWKNTGNAEDVKKFIEYVVSDDDFLERYTLASGEMVGNIAVANRISDKFSEPFLGGQNHYAIFAEIAMNINGKIAQATDRVIEDLFMETVKDFVYDGKPKEQALAEFRHYAKAMLDLD